MGSQGNSGRRVLVVANETVDGEALARQLREDGAGAGRIFVVAPMLIDSALKHEMGDVDEARGPAEERLEHLTSELRDAGFEADGEVGDADPILAIQDELQKFPADEIFLIHHPGDQEAYAEKGLLERVRRDFSLPVTELVVPRGEGDPEPLETHHEEGGPPERDLEGIGSSENLPRMRRQDLAAIILGMLLTGVLVVLAADCAAGGEDGIEGECAVQTLIAGVALLANLAHVVGLLLFESVAYRGLWERFMARLTLVGTGVATLVSLAITAL
jgi:hypothetical protein